MKLRAQLTQDYQQLKVSTKREELEKQLNYVHPQGILISGQPGTGKTFAAKAIAAASGYPTIYIQSSTATGKIWVGAVEQGINDLALEIQALSAREGGVVLILDEIENLIQNRNQVDIGSLHRQAKANCNATMNLLDRCREVNALVIGITNVNIDEQLDPAVKRSGRLEIPCLFKNPFTGGSQGGTQRLFASRLKSLCQDNELLNECLTADNCQRVAAYFCQLTKCQKEPTTFVMADLASYVNTLYCTLKHQMGDYSGTLRQWYHTCNTEDEQQIADLQDDDLNLDEQLSSLEDPHLLEDELVDTDLVIPIGKLFNKRQNQDVDDTNPFLEHPNCTDPEQIDLIFGYGKYHVGINPIHRGLGDEREIDTSIAQFVLRSAKEWVKEHRILEHPLPDPNIPECHVPTFIEADLQQWLAKRSLVRYQAPRSNSSHNRAGYSRPSQDSSGNIELHFHYHYAH